MLAEFEKTNLYSVHHYPSALSVSLLKKKKKKKKKLLMKETLTKDLDYDWPAVK